jgi:hypothetical protein
VTQRLLTFTGKKKCRLFAAQVKVVAEERKDTHAA